MITICKRFEFHAAHHLPNHKGKCKNVHGHTYLLDIEVTGGVQKIGRQKGMIMDFGDLKYLVDENILGMVDHKDLNTLWNNPTAEVMVDEVAGRLRRALPRHIELIRVRLYETATSYAEWRKG
jgi:6-pyruvoyltetrahydropterin/6-carboxytetrahydropterin synthase